MDCTYETGGVESIHRINKIDIIDFPERHYIAVYTRDNLVYSAGPVTSLDELKKMIDIEGCQKQNVEYFYFDYLKPQQ